jgi:methyl-accepting chemotaxis protein
MASDGKAKGRNGSHAASRARDRNQKIEERIATATEQLASGVTQAASAAEQLRRAMEQNKPLLYKRFFSAGASLQTLGTV